MDEYDSGRDYLSELSDEEKRLGVTEYIAFLRSQIVELSDEIDRIKTLLVIDDE